MDFAPIVLINGIPPHEIRFQTFIVLSDISQRHMWLQRYGNPNSNILNNLCDARMGI